MTDAAEPIVDILSVDVSTADGALAANVAQVDVGGGERVVTVDGEATILTSPRTTVWHARLYAISPFVPDTLRVCDSYDEALTVAKEYAGALAARRDEIVALQAEIVP